MGRDVKGAALARRIAWGMTATAVLACAMACSAPSTMPPVTVIEAPSTPTASASSPSAPVAPLTIRSQKTARVGSLIPLGLVRDASNTLVSWGLGADGDFVAALTDGQPVWSFHLSKDANLTGAACGSGGSVLLTGSFYKGIELPGVPPIQARGAAFFVSRVVAGKAVSIKSIAGTGTTSALHVVAVGDDHFVIAGGFAADLELGAQRLKGGASNAKDPDFKNLFVAKIDKHAKVIWAKELKGAARIESLSWTGERIIVAGDFEGSLMVSPTVQLENHSKEATAGFAVTLDGAGEDASGFEHALWRPTADRAGNLYGCNDTHSGAGITPSGFVKLDPKGKSLGQWTLPIDTATCLSILPARGNIVYVSGRAEEAGTGVVRVARLDTSTGATSHRTIPNVAIGAIAPLLVGDPIGSSDPTGITAVAVLDAPDNPLLVVTLEP